MDTEPVRITYAVLAAVVAVLGFASTLHVVTADQVQAWTVWLTAFVDGLVPVIIAVGEFIRGRVWAPATVARTIVKVAEEGASPA